jgi:hypothetical protein
MTSWLHTDVSFRTIIISINLFSPIYHFKDPCLVPSSPSSKN